MVGKKRAASNLPAQATRALPRVMAILSKREPGRGRMSVAYNIVGVDRVVCIDGVVLCPCPVVQNGGRGLNLYTQTHSRTTMWGWG